MKREIASFLRRLRRDESGAVAVLVAIAMTALIGMAALAIDVGNIFYAQRRLQATADMAALAGALEIYCTGTGCGTAVNAAIAYSAVSGNKNVQTGLTVTMASGYPKLECLTTLQNQGLQCTSATAPSPNANAIEVKEQATVPFYLAEVFGFGSVQLTATSLAGGKGTGGLPPLNVMMVIDTTGSMNTNDPNGTASTCGVANPTRLQCAMFGVRTLLAELWPTRDQVGLMVFPQVSTATAPDDYSCNTNTQPTIEPYSATSPTATYQIVAASSDYRTSNTSGLTSNSNLDEAAQYRGCAGVKSRGGEGTYFAGAIYAAQNALVASNDTGVCATQNCQNVIILLSDGGAGSASNLWSDTTNQATLPGGTSLTMATTVPPDVIPGSSVADNTTASAIPAGTQVVSTSGATVVLSNAVTAAATDATNAATPPGNTTLHFASVPSAVATGMAVNDQTRSSAIAACTKVVSKTATTVTLSNAATGTTVATDITSAATATGQTTLFFASVPGTITTGMGVADTTTGSAIPTGTTVVSFTATTVTLSSPVGLTVTDRTNRTATNTTTLQFNSVPATVQPHMTITGSGIPANTTVVSTTSNTVVISQRVATVASGTTITFSGDSVAKGDTITFSTDVASGDTIIFGGVGCGDTIAFGSNNQCHEAITAAQNAAKAGTWVYSVAYGASTALSPDSNSCSDTETPRISSCTTMQDIASDSSKFYSDGSGGSGSCTSPNSANNLGSIFQQIGNSLLYTALLPNNTD